MVTRLEHLINWFDEQLFQDPKVRDERVLRSTWMNLKSEIEKQEASLKDSSSELKAIIENFEKEG